MAGGFAEARRGRRISREEGGRRREEEGRSIFKINFVNSRHVLQASLHLSLSSSSTTWKIYRFRKFSSHEVLLSVVIDVS
jgi:hypothetical protein